MSGYYLLKKDSAPWSYLVNYLDTSQVCFTLTTSERTEARQTLCKKIVVCLWLTSIQILLLELYNDSRNQNVSRALHVVMYYSPKESTNVLRNF